MSYCRWSSDDFACDLYCYESDYGYVTHVATSRVVGPVPPLPTYDQLQKLDVDAIQAAFEAQYAYLDTAEHVDIGLPHDGERFVDDALDKFEARLMELRRMGYRFPDYVFDIIAEEKEVHPEPPAVIVPPLSTKHTTAHATYAGRATPWVEGHYDEDRDCQS